MGRRMSDGPADRDATRSGTALVRGVLFLGLWCVLIGTGHLVIGVVTAALATAASLRLLPPGPRRLRLGGLPSFALRFARQSVVAGWDVARRAFDPRVPVRPGFVTYRVGFPARRRPQRLHGHHRSRPRDRARGRG